MSAYGVFERCNVNARTLFDEKFALKTAVTELVF